MSDEEIEEEIEALEAIFGDEFERLANSTSGEPQMRVRILSTPDDEDDTSDVQFDLTIALPKGYPETPARTALRPTCGMTVARLARLEAALSRTAAEMSGEQQLFALASLAKEHADGLVDDDDDASGDAEANAIDEGLVPKVRNGVKVTPETFAAWREAYDKEMESCTDPNLGITLDPSRRLGKVLTGREQFLMASASTLGDEEEEDEDDEDFVNEEDKTNTNAVAAPAIDEVVNDATIFRAVQENLDDLEFSDEDDE